MNLTSIFLSVPVLVLGLGMPAAAFEPVISLGNGHARIAVSMTTVHAAGGVFEVATSAGEVLATPAQTGGTFSVLTVAGLAGRGADATLISAGGAEAWYVLDGTFEFHIGERVFEGGPGTFVAVDAGQVRSYAGKTDGTLLAVVSGAFADPSTSQTELGPELGRLQGSYGQIAD
jgi:quercetin dioxygenase-like cupin family protein